MSLFDWDDAKNRLLQETRGVSFEDVVFHIERGDILDIIRHHDPGRYPGQNIMVVNIDGYVYLVPYVQDGNTKFLKTIIPSRKATRDYL